MIVSYNRSFCLFFTAIATIIIFWSCNKNRDTLHQEDVLDNEPLDIEWTGDYLEVEDIEDFDVSISNIKVILPKTVPVNLPFPAVISTKDGSPKTFDLNVMGNVVHCYQGKGSISLVLEKVGEFSLDVRSEIGDESLIINVVEPNPKVIKKVSKDDLVWYGFIKVASNLSILPEDTLKILPGCIVMLEPNVNIDIMGQIVIEGTEDEPIVFTRASDKGWGGLSIYGKGIIKHAFFLGGGADISKTFGHSTSQPVIFVKNGSLTMTNSGVIDNIGKAFGSMNAEITLSNVMIARNDTGGQFNNSAVLVENCHFLETPDADGKVDDDDNDGIYLSGVMVKDGKPVLSIIRNSVFAVGEDDAIDHNDAEVLVDGVFIKGFFHEGIAGSSGHRIVVQNSVIQECEQGVEAGYGSPEVIVDHCLITKNKVGLRYGDDYDWDVLGILKVTNTISVMNKDANVLNYVRKVGGAVPEGIAISCSMVDTPEWDNINGNIPGIPVLDENGLLMPDSPGKGMGCDGSDPGLKHK